MRINKAKPRKNMLLFMIVCSILVYMSPSCSTKGDNPEKVIMRYLHEDAPEKLKEYLTPGSQKMLIEIQKKTGVVSPLALITAHHSPDAEFIITDEKTHPGNSQITLQCVDHPNENARGFTVSYELVNQSGEWKVDLTGELQPILSE